jgi:hypothetical protein
VPRQVWRYVNGNVEYDAYADGVCAADGLPLRADSGLFPTYGRFPLRPIPAYGRFPLTDDRQPDLVHVVRVLSGRKTCAHGRPQRGARGGTLSSTPTGVLTRVPFRVPQQGYSHEYPFEYPCWGTHTGTLWSTPTGVLTGVPFRVPQRGYSPGLRVQVRAACARDGTGRRAAVRHVPAVRGGRVRRCALQGTPRGYSFECS